MTTLATTKLSPVKSVLFQLDPTYPIIVFSSHSRYEKRFGKVIELYHNNKVQDAYYHFSVVRKLYDPETSPPQEKAGFIAFDAIFRNLLQHDDKGDLSYSTCN